MRKSALFIATLVAMHTSANAASFCYLSGDSLLSDGATIHQHLRIVVSSVARPERPLPEDRGDHTWCALDRRVLSGFLGHDIAVPPKNGQLHTRGYKIRYRGDKIGADHFELVEKWLGRVNDPRSGRIVVDVDVVPEPF